LEADGGWSIAAVGMDLGVDQEYEIGVAPLAEADHLHHAAAVAKRKLGNITRAPTPGGVESARSSA
jgi:hypothetical protein